MVNILIQEKIWNIRKNIKCGRYNSFFAIYTSM